LRTIWQRSYQDNTVVLGLKRSRRKLEWVHNIVKKPCDFIFLSYLGTQWLWISCCYGVDLQHAATTFLHDHAHEFDGARDRCIL
jgi:hypothetical protein